jgi:hypothetical protein
MKHNLKEHHIGPMFTFFLNQIFNIQVVNIMLSKKQWRSQITHVIIEF